MLTLGQRGRPSLQAPFNHPADVAVSPAGEIYVADGYGNSSVHRFSVEGEHLGSWGAPGAGRGEFTTPHGIWVDAQDRVLVADRENNRVQLFSPEGDYYGEWRDLYHPMDIYVDAARHRLRHRPDSRASACTPRTGDCWPAAGRSTWAPTVSGATRGATSTSPRSASTR